MRGESKGKPFEKNDPRINRKGRPAKGAALTEILSDKLDAVKDGKTRREIVAERLIELAENGDIAALKYVFDRTDGKPKESVELSGGAVDQKLREILNG
jgi:hypothetical protein